jgi:putative ABC transport system permease protein
MEIFRLVRRNVLRDKRRLLLTVASVSVIVILLAVLLTVYNTLEASVNDPRAQRILAMRDRTSLFPGGLPEAYADSLRAIAGVEDVMPWNLIFTRVDPTYGLMGLAVDPEPLPRLMPPLVEDVPAEQYRAFLANRTGVLMGREAMNRFGWKVGDTLTLLGGSVNANFPVRIEGVLDFDLTADNFIMHHEYLRALRCDCAAATADVIFFRAADTADPDAVRAAVAEHFLGQPVPIELITVVEFVSEIVAQSGDASRLVLVMVGVIALATLLVVANTLAMAARERYRDVAILRALGFRGRHVFELILGEAGVVALAGCLLGGAVAFAAFHATGFSMRMGAQSYFTVGGLTVVESVAAGLVMGLLAGLGPALVCLKVDVVDALRKVV